MIVTRKLAGDMANRLYAASQKRCKKIVKNGLKSKANEILEIFTVNPFQRPANPCVLTHNLI